MSSLIKFAIFAFAFLVAVPLLTAYARSSEKRRDQIFFLMVLTSCTLICIHIAPLPEWRGSSRGYAFFLTDFLMMALLGSMLLSSKIRVAFFPPGVFFYLLYFSFCCISVAYSDLKPQGGFELLKMFFLYFYFVTIYNYIRMRKSLWPFFYVMIGVGALMFSVGFYQKYIGSWRYQIPSTMPHQNSAALYCEMFGCILMGILFNEKLTRKELFLTLCGLGFNSMLILFTLSRGGLICFAFGVCGTVAASFLVGGFSLYKMRLLSLLIVIGSIPLAYAAPRIIQRFLYAPESSGTTRVNLARAAVRMANDWFWGVGLNAFSSKSGPDYDYNREHYEEYTNMEALDSRVGGIVETVYLLVAAECGWITLAAMLLWFLSFYLANIANMFAYRHLPGFGVAAGIFGGLSSNYFQSMLEWVLRQYQNLYQLVLVFAVISAMVYFKKRRKAALRRLK